MQCSPADWLLLTGCLPAITHLIRYPTAAAVSSGAAAAAADPQVRRSRILRYHYSGQLVIIKHNLENSSSSRLQRRQRW